jgi:hypothetical protein
MLLDHSGDHLEMAELFEYDVVQHVADRRILDMEGLGPVGQCGAKFAGCPLNCSIAPVITLRRRSP